MQNKSCSLPFYWQRPKYYFEMEGVRDSDPSGLDSLIAGLFFGFSGNGYVSRLEVVRAAEKAVSGSSKLVGEFFDRYFDSAQQRRGTMQLYDFAFGLGNAMVEEQPPLEGDTQKLFFVWDKQTQIPVLAKQQKHRDEEDNKKKFLLLLSMQWMEDAGKLAAVKTFENQVGGALFVLFCFCFCFCFFFFLQILFFFKATREMQR